uniref:LRRcap domain-containing protein n=1 Tax=Caenorhabditis tropicalis TaxID=1561998 RepID=A0A1I7USS8_9PELO
MTSMEEKYVREIRDRDPATVDTLFLDNVKDGKIGGINDKLTNLTMLSMVRCGLTTLAGFPLLPALTYLDISDNQLGDDASFDVLVKNAPELERITLASNKLTLDNLRPLKMLPKLSELDLTNNAALGLLEEYRVKVFEMIPSLKILDGCDVDGDEVEEEEFTGEGGEGESGEESGDEEGPGLSYLNKSQFSDDETDDYVPEENGDESRGVKRAASGEDDDEEPESKKAAADDE